MQNNNNDSIGVVNPIFDQNALVAFIEARVKAAIAEHMRRPIRTEDLTPKERRAFHAKCRELHAAGDKRVMKASPRKWVADRSIFEPTAEAPPSAPAQWDAGKIVAMGPRKGRAS